MSIDDLYWTIQIKCEQRMSFLCAPNPALNPFPFFFVNLHFWFLVSMILFECYQHSLWQTGKNKPRIIHSKTLQSAFLNLLPDWMPNITEIIFGFTRLIVVLILNQQGERIYCMLKHALNYQSHLNIRSVN